LGAERHFNVTTPLPYSSFSKFFGVAGRFTTQVIGSKFGVNDVSLSDGPLTLVEAATYLKIPVRSLRDLCKRKRISHARLNYRTFRFRKSDLEIYLNRRTIPAKGV
jgi:excisionase family DNA binding protein